jgi:hypothetical protein
MLTINTPYAKRPTPYGSCGALYDISISLPWWSSS